jgi:hypothetical protein
MVLNCFKVVEAKPKVKNTKDQDKLNTQEVCSIEIIDNRMRTPIFSQ